MIHGLEHFRIRFAQYANNFILVGGVAAYLQLDESLTDEEKIVELGISFGEVRIKDLIEKISISRNTATRKMNILIERKLFERKGKGAGVFFKYKGKKDE